MKIGQTRAAWPSWKSGLVLPWIMFWSLAFAALEWLGNCVIIDPERGGLPFAEWPWWHRAFCHLGEFAFRESMRGYETRRVK